MTSRSESVRSVRTSPWPIRAWFGVLSRLAPSVAEEQAARLFLTLRLRRTPSPTALHAKLLPERAMERRAGEADPAYPALSTGRITLWSWGRGPTVLLVHGWSGAAGDMAPIAAELVRAGFRAVLFDMPSQPSSAPGKTNLFVHIRTIAELAATLGPIHSIVSHSLGATATAVALGDRVLTARSAVLLAPAISPWALSYHFARIIGLAQARVPGMIRQAEKLVGRSADSLNAVEAVRGLEIPGYLVHDPEDLDVPFDHSTAIAAAWKDSRLVPRPGLGHQQILNDPATIQGVVRFVRGVQTTDAPGAQERQMQKA